MNGRRTSRIPRVAVAAVVARDERVLMIRRRNPPNAGLWSLPGGKVRWREPLAAAVAREVAEETGIVVETAAPLYVLDWIEADAPQAVHYVIIDFIAHWRGGTPRAGGDALEVAWFTLAELNTATVEQRTRRLLEQCWARLHQ